MTYSTIRPRATIVLLAALMVVAGLAVLPAPAAIAGDVFDDVDNTSVFADDIEWLAGVGVTRGCNPPYNTNFCPQNVVTRGQMAAFLGRALGLPAASGIDFVDDNGTTFEADIERLAAAGITRGCNPPVNNRFCPDDPVTRGQMAAFMTRALDLPAGSGINFTDDDNSPFEDDIERMAAAGITRGCNPPSNTRFCPNDLVTRQQMAAFLHRALGDRLFVKTFLTDLTPVDDNEYVREGGIYVNGEAFLQSVYWAQDTNDRPGWVEYNLGRDYSQFCALVGVSDGSETYASFEVEVLVDGISKFTGQIALGQPVPVKVDVTDGLRMRIEARETASVFQNANIVWGDAHLQDSGECTVPAGIPSPAPAPKTYLSSKTPVDDNEYVRTGSLAIDGDIYTKSMYWAQDTNDNPGWVEYSLSRDFSQFCALVGISDGSETYASFEVEVLVDGISKFTGPIALGQPIPVKVDVTDGLRMRLVARETASVFQNANIVWGDAHLQDSGECTVPVGDPSPTPAPQTYLSSKTPVDDNEYIRTGSVTVDGDIYTKSMYWAQDTNDNPGWVEYNLSRDYSRFCSVVGISDSSEAGASFEVEAYVDGSSVFVGDIALGQTVTIDTSIADGLRLKLIARETASAFYNANIVWADAYLSTGPCS